MQCILIGVIALLLVRVTVGLILFSILHVEMTALIKMWIAQLSCFDMDRSQLSMMHNKRKHSDSKHQFLRTSISQTTGNSFLCRV